jgi:hypothetical protein
VLSCLLPYCNRTCCLKEGSVLNWKVEYYHSIRLSVSTLVDRDVLCNRPWCLSYEIDDNNNNNNNNNNSNNSNSNYNYIDDDLVPISQIRVFNPDGCYPLSRMGPLKWMLAPPNGVRLGGFPPFLLSRSPDWGYKLSNGQVIELLIIVFSVSDVVSGLFAFYARE